MPTDQTSLGSRWELSCSVCVLFVRHVIHVSGGVELKCLIDNESPECENLKSRDGVVILVIIELINVLVWHVSLSLPTIKNISAYIVLCHNIETISSISPCS